MRAGVYRHWEIAMGSTPPSLQRVSLPLTSASWVARWTSHAVVQICNNPEDVTFDVFLLFFFFSSRRRHTRCSRDWSSDVCSSDLFRLHGAHRLVQCRKVNYFPAQIVGLCSLVGGLQAAEKDPGYVIDILQVLQATIEIGRASCRERV